MSNKPCRAVDPSNCRYHKTGSYSDKEQALKNFYGNQGGLPAPLTTFKTNYAEVNELDSLRRKYHAAFNDGNFPLMNETKQQIIQLATSTRDTKFIPKLVMEGKCGIDGCSFATKGGMAPHHYAGANCKSGKHNHCTCDSCF